MRTDGSDTTWVWNVLAIEGLEGSDGTDAASKESGAAAGEDGKTRFGPGQRVRVRNISAAEAEQLAKGHGGWNSKMAKDLGKVGTVTQRISSSMVRVDVDKGGNFVWNVQTLEALGGPLVELPTEFKKGQIAASRQ